MHEASRRRPRGDLYGKGSSALEWGVAKGLEFMSLPAQHVTTTVITLASVASYLSSSKRPRDGV